MPEELIVPPRTFAKVFAALLALLGLTVGVNFLPLGGFALPVALGIAGVKAALILLFFMEVRYRSRLTALFAGAAFVWLAILLTLMMMDYRTRGRLEPDWRAGTGPTNHLEFPTDQPPTPAGRPGVNR